MKYSEKMADQKKIALITGASKGIGKAIAMGLAESGYFTVLIGRNEKDLWNVAVLIKQKSKFEPHISILDITKKKKVSEFVDDILVKFNRIDVLVNNAGIYENGTTELSDENFSRMIETNLMAQFNLLSKIVPVMKKQKSGYIFNVASRAGKIGFAGSGGYSASKFGLVGLNESSYRELNPLGISVTALCPGWVDTNMAYKAGTPLKGKEMIQPEDLNRTVQWLLSLSPGACVKEVILETPYNIS